MDRDGARGRITLWWIGEGPFDAPMLGRVAHHIAAEYGSDVRLADAPDRPQGTRDERRGQHSSRDVLRWLSDRTPVREGRLLGLTDVDLFIPVLTFVFGEAQLDGRTAVVSIARLVDPRDRARTEARLAREAVHELGHTFGLLHCASLEGQGRRARPCVMARSPGVGAVDGKSARLCEMCRTRYTLYQQDGSHVYREHENPDR